MWRGPRASNYRGGVQVPQEGLRQELGSWTKRNQSVIVYNQERLPRGRGMIISMTTLLNIVIITGTTVITINISVV